MLITEKQRERFWRKVNKDSEFFECWDWTGYRNQVYLGNNQDNMDDKCRMDRQAKGETNGSSKLKGDEVLLMRGLYNSGKYLQSELAEKFNISQSMTSYIVRNAYWKHL